MNIVVPSLLIATGAIIGIGLLGPQPGAPSKAPSAAAPPAPADPEKKPTLAQLTGADPSSREQVEPLLLEIAREYKTYRRVSDSAHWAPELCYVPAPAGVLESTSKDAATHGKKLYFLYARDEKNYNAIGWSSYDEKPEGKPFAASVGQVVVKESFKPVEVTDAKDIPAPPKPDPDDPNRGLQRPRDLPEDYTHDAAGHLFHTGDPAGLFIMAKLAVTETPGTDQGWIYATISPDLKQVTAFGRIESCMECHTKTKHDRLFGPKWLQEREAREQQPEHKDYPSKSPAPPVGPDRQTK